MAGKKIELVGDIEEAPEREVVEHRKPVDRGPLLRALTTFSVTVDGRSYSYSEGAVFPASDCPFDPALMERVG